MNMHKKAQLLGMRIAKAGFLANTNADWESLMRVSNKTYHLKRLGITIKWDINNIQHRDD